MLWASILVLAFPPSAPAALRFESGRHTGPVRGIARDPLSGDWVSVSDDKSVRRWHEGAAVGQPLRFATGDASNGRFQCCAVSRSGLLAVGDYDQIQPSVWLYDPSKGQSGAVRRIALKRRDVNDASAIYCIAFSPDGEVLAAGDDAGTLHLWNSRDGALMAEVRLAPNKGCAITALAFAPSGGRLAYSMSGAGVPPAVGVVDGQKGTPVVPSLRPPRAVDSLAWAGPSTLALGGQSGSLQVWKPGEREVRNLPTGLAEEKALTICALSASSDGRRLAGGTNAGDLLLFDGLDAAPRRVKVAEDESEVWAVGLTPDGQKAVAGLGNGGILEVDAASGKPSGVLSPKGLRVEKLRWTSDGNGLRWRSDGHDLGFDLQGSAPVAKGDDATEDGHRLGGISARVEKWRLVVEGSNRWAGVDLYPVYDAVLLDKDRLLIASSRGLFVADDRRAAPVEIGDPRSLARSPDGKRVAVGFADGLVRIYDTEYPAKGPVASLYLGGGEWVAWQENTGLYDSSPNGDAIFGYQVNGAPEELARFVPAVARETGYRHPGLLPSLLGLSAAPPPAKPAVELAAAVATVPTFRVLSVEEGEVVGEGFQVKSDTALFRVQVENPGKERISLRVGHDGTPRELREGTPRDLGDRGMILIPGKSPNERICRVTGLVPGVNLVTIYAGDKPLPNSSFHVVRVSSGPAVPARLLVLSVGIGDYGKTDIPRLPSAVDDAKSFIETVLANAPEGTETLKMPLYNADATREGIEKGLDWLKKNSTPNDRVMVFLASHGDLKEGTTYVAPYDYDKGNPAARGLPWTDVATRLASVPCRSLVLFCDNCFSGAVVGATLKATPREATESMRGLSSDMAVFAACTGEQTSREYAELKHGLFTYALLKGLSGEGFPVDPTTGEVTTDMLKVIVPITMRDWQSVQGITSPQTPVILVPTQAAIPVSRPKVPRRGKA